MSLIRSLIVVSRADLQIGTPATALLGIFLGYRIPPAMPSILYLILCILLVTIASHINCMYDLEVDKRYKKELAEAVLTIGIRNFKLLIFAESLIVGILILWFLLNDILVAILSIIGLFLAYSYSTPPLRIKDKGWLNPIPTFIGLYFFPILAGWSIVRKDFPPYFIAFLISYTLMNSGFLLINIGEDYDEDRKCGIKTWAHMLGLKKTAKLSFIFALFGIGCIVTIIQPFNIFSSIFIILAFLGLINSLKDIYEIIKAHPKRMAFKKYAKKIPIWFFTTRYPMLLAIVVKIIS